MKSRILLSVSSGWCWLREFFGCFRQFMVNFQPSIIWFCCCWFFVGTRRATEFSRPEFSSLVISGEQNPTHLYEQAHDRVGNRCGQEGENHLSATFCSFLLGRVCLEKGNRCPGERNQQANHGTNYRVGQTDKSGNDGDDYVGTRLAHLL